MHTEEQYYYDLSTEQGKKEYQEAVKRGFGPIDAYQSINASYRGRQNFVDIDTNLSARNEFTQRNYDFFRPSEATPTKIKDIIRACSDCYYRFPLAYYVINLMSTFPKQGIRIVHPNKKVQNFYRKWWKTVRGSERSERFLNHLHRLGNVISKRSTAKLKAGSVKKYMSVMGADLTDSESPKPEKRELPRRYTFLNPCTVEVLGGEELSPFIGKFRYGIIVPDSIKKILRKKNKTKEEQELIADFPSDILEEIVTSKSKYISLPANKIQVFHYKKDDWQTWAYPVLYPVLNTIYLLEKMQLCDKAALDGAISNIRVWTMGDIDKELVPTEAAINKLASLLTNNVGGGIVDLIWSSDLKLQESNSQVHEFLGKEKYEGPWSQLYAGIGLPQTLTGGGGGQTNNYVSIKTFVQLLEYSRDLLVEFWENEFKEVRAAMRGIPGFEQLPRLAFDHTNLSDETAQKALILQLLDRGIISRECAVENFGEMFDIEVSRMGDEKKLVDKGKVDDYRGPYGLADVDYKKILLQSGEVTPSEIGIDLDENDPLQKRPADLKREMENKKLKLTPSKPKGVAGEGRPLNSRDTKQRKKKVVKPYTGKTVADIESINAAQDEIKKILVPCFEAKYGKLESQFTRAENNVLNSLVFDSLYNLDSLGNVTEESVSKSLSNPRYKNISELRSKFFESMENQIGQKVADEDIQQIQSRLYLVLRS